MLKVFIILKHKKKHDVESIISNLVSKHIFMKHV